ncbi:MAG: DNA-binding protein WhiA [Candidatus Dormibacteria bacterium]
MAGAEGSFTSRVLAEVAPHVPPLGCCRRALLEGMALAVGTSRAEDGEGDEVAIPRPVAARSGLAALHSLGIPARVVRRRAARRPRYVLVAPGLAGVRGSERSCCRRLRLRGAFLAAGSVSRPQGAPQAELRAYDQAAAARLHSDCVVLELGARAAARRGRPLVILSGSAAVAGLLSTVGAQGARLRFEQGRVVAELRGEINRRTNAETANLRRAVRASVAQLEAVGRLQRIPGRYEALPSSLRAAADLRQRHPDDTLERLAQRAGCSRAAMAGRLHRLLGAAPD